MGQVLQESPLSDYEDQLIKTSIENRKKFILQLIHYAANLLDPKFNGKGLTRLNQLEDQKFIHDRVMYKYGNNKNSVNQILQDLAEYRSGSGIYAKDFVKSVIGTVKAPIWYKGTLVGSELRVIAVDILGIPLNKCSHRKKFQCF